VARTGGPSSKLDEQRTTLGGQGFDVLGEAFRASPVRDLLRAIRDGDGSTFAAAEYAADERVGDSRGCRNRPVLSGALRIDSIREVQQRVRTVDGQLHVASPPGGPTRVTVELPLRA
jgi:hypothetical protein